MEDKNVLSDCTSIKLRHRVPGQTFTDNSKDIS